MGTVFKIRVVRGWWQASWQAHRYSTIQFKTHAGKKRHFELKVSLSWPYFWFKEGDAIPVLYHPDDPRKAAVGLWFTLWGYKLSFGIVGLGFILFGLAGLHIVPLEWFNLKSG